jgi:hypothetical protein
MELKQATFEELVDSERSLVLSAEARYGKYYLNARACSIFVSRSIESVELSHHDTFGRFFAQLKKHQMLALLSAVRLHKVQSMMNLRQVLEAGAAAAFAIANPEMHHFVDTDENGLVDPLRNSPKSAIAGLTNTFQPVLRRSRRKKSLSTEPHCWQLSHRSQPSIGRHPARSCAWAGPRPFSQPPLFSPRRHFLAPG